MSYTYFETEGSSSGRRLYVQVLYCIVLLVTCQRYKQSCSWNSLFRTAPMVTEQKDKICAWGADRERNKSAF